MALASDLAALLLLLVSAKLGEMTYDQRTLGSTFAFLGSTLLGVVSGYRVVAAAFRRGRRRQGRDPEPPPPGFFRFMGGFVGFWIKLILGFAFWALLLQFFKRVY